MDFDPSVQALQAFGGGMQISAHNIANVNTPDFAATSYSFETGPDDRGVRLVPHPDSVLPSTSGWRDSRGLAEGMQGTQRSGAAASPEAPSQEALDRGLAANTVDVSREMVNMMHLERAFDANATVVRTIEETSGTLINMKA